MVLRTKKSASTAAEEVRGGWVVGDAFCPGETTSSATAVPETRRVLTEGNEERKRTDKDSSQQRCHASTGCTVRCVMVRPSLLGETAPNPKGLADQAANQGRQEGKQAGGHSPEGSWKGKGPVRAGGLSRGLRGLFTASFEAGRRLWSCRVALRMGVRGCVTEMGGPSFLPRVGGRLSVS